MTELIVLRALLREARLRARSMHETGVRGNERGDIVGELIMIAMLAAAALAVGLILYNKFVAKANSIPTN